MLSARRERPGHGRAAKQSHEFTSFQLTELHTPAQAKGVHISMADWRGSC